ncbi:MAG: hypothetical protein RPU32_09295 [Candidatus Sedimenticola sp. (ex Thyasira tokunagai)]
MEIKIDVESAFADFVREFGGEVLEDTLPKSPDFKNADYLFRDEQVVAELKRFSDDKSSDQNIQNKIQKLFDGWMEEGIVIGYGRMVIQSNTLPQECQRQLIDVYKPPIKNSVLKANKQIKATMQREKFEGGKGLLIIANDGNYALEADAALYLIWRVLGERFRSINSVVYFTANMFAQSPHTEKPVLVWAHASRTDPAPVDDDFVSRLFRGWSGYLERVTGAPIEEIIMNEPSDLEKIRYIK